MSICTIDDCDRAILSRNSHGWCRLHYDRWRRNGTTETGYGPGPLVCICPTPQPAPIDDMCTRCYRVVAERVHARRAAREAVA